jgi:hypothetical protein
VEAFERLAAKGNNLQLAGFFCQLKLVFGADWIYFAKLVDGLPVRSPAYSIFHTQEHSQLCQEQLAPGTYTQ